MEPLFSLPEDLAALSEDELRSFIAEATGVVEAVAAAPADYAKGRELMDELTSGVAAIEAARAELETREAAAAEEAEEVTAEAETAEIDADAIAELAARARGTEETAEVEEVEEVEEAEEEAVTAAAEETEAEEVAAAEEPAEEPEAVVAAAEPAPLRQLPRPARSRASAPRKEEARIALTAAAEYLGYGLGEELPDANSLAKMMVTLRRRFGNIPEGTHGEKIPVARADWSNLYPEERTLGEVAGPNMDKISAVTADAVIRDAFSQRQKQGGSLTASGGLCAPVTPYYQLQMLSIADRPVRAALPAFNADRGGIIAARPASLSAVTTAVGIITEEEDELGGSFATKTCQVIPCPAFTETDVDTIYHCLQFGNLGARTFPELVAQWNSLVLAAHARTAETNCLDAIGTASTAVTASSIGLGASSTLPSQILTAANGMRNRHRMRPDAVLRVMLPEWVGDLLVSDVYRSQFQRFDMDVNRFVALLRAGNVEPTFYLDGETGAGQVFGSQAAAALNGFPATVVWYIYPEGSFLYLDGGTLELGLVRDSVLNSTNDFQIFGESFENVAFVGVESLKVTTTTCDSGAVSLPVAVSECGDYGIS